MTNGGYISTTNFIEEDQKPAQIDYVVKFGNILTISGVILTIIYGISLYLHNIFNVDSFIFGAGCIVFGYELYRMFDNKFGGKF